MGAGGRDGNSASYTPLDFNLGGLNGVQLDIVGFLAILGEASVLANAQVSSLSRFSWLPRLLPAPQALIRHERPVNLEGATGKVVGAQSGNLQQRINHVAHILHSEDDGMERYTVRVVRVTDADEKRDIKARWYSPLTGLAILGCLMSLVLLVYSILQGDGYSFLAVILLAVLGTLIGFANYWELELPRRTEDRAVPPTDIVINYPNGSFLVIKDCDEAVARKLYFAPEHCKYWVGEQVYRAISLVGTLLLMGGVITLANANSYCQLAWAIAYISLNAAYWVVAALPQRWNWDLSRFQVKRVRTNLGETSPTFTVALWKVVALTCKSRWARVADIAPNSPAWDSWLEEAEEAAHGDPDISTPIEGYPTNDDGFTHEYLSLPKWDSREALTRIMKAESNKA